MMARKRKKELSERQRRILEVIHEYQDENGYPPSIRVIGQMADISSTSVVNYYLLQLEEMELLKRDEHVARGICLTDKAKEVIGKLEETIRDIFKIRLEGYIVASAPAPMPSTDFAYFDEATSIEVARSMLPTREDPEKLYALQVKGDSMIDAMVNDGDFVVMKPVQEARNGEMVAVWLEDKEETTLKYFFRENGRVRLQPANPTMDPIIIDDPKHVRIQGKVMMVIRNIH